MSMAMIVFLTSWAAQTWAIVVEASPWLLGGFLLAGMVSVLFPVGIVTRQLGKPGLSGVVKAALLGIPLPLCSCSVIPVASSIRKQGASPGAFVSFLISTPETGVDSIALSYALLGPLWAVLRPVAAFVTAVIAGLLTSACRFAEPSGVESATVDGQSGDACTNGCGCPEPADSRRSGRIKRAVRYGLIEMIADLSPWLVAGFLLAGLAAAIIPEGYLERHIGSGLPAMLLMLVVGLPLYVCSTSSTPIAAVLIARGLSPGAALVFLLAGPATNIATMLVVFRDLGRRGLAIYVATIAVVAVLFGLGVDLLASSTQLSLAEVPAGVHGDPAGWTLPVAVVMVVLIFNGLRLRLSARFAG